MRITITKKNKIKFDFLLIAATIAWIVPIIVFVITWVSGDVTSLHISLGLLSLATLGLLSVGMLNTIKFSKFRWEKKVNEKSNTQGVRLTNALMDSDLLVPDEPKRHTINLVKS